MDINITKQVEEAIQKCREILLFQENWKEVPSFEVSYGLKGYKTLGEANFEKGTMRLHYELLKENPKLYIKDIVLHEYAHFVIRALYPNDFNYETQKRITMHGKEFKEICKLFNAASGASTSLFNSSKVLSSIKDKKRVLFDYTCGCMTHNISKIKHNKIIDGINYKCSICNNRLKIVA